MYCTERDLAIGEEVEVKEFITDDDNSWKTGMLEDTVSSNMSDMIVNIIKPQIRVFRIDKPWWT